MPHLAQLRLSALPLLLVLVAACGGDGGTSLDDGAKIDTDTAEPPGDTRADTAIDDISDDDTAATDVTVACPGDVTPGDGVVVTERGAVSGVAEGGVTRFLGVPYAAPPIDALRWRPPEPHPCWAGVRAADTWPSACVQKDFQQGRAEAPIIGAEDCLYLNLWAPDEAPAPRPVMVFVHGGGNISGATASETFGVHLYDGARLAATAGAVVVTLEYRLGPLGFLAHPALSARSDDGVSGNYGLLDQLFALGWVRRNIAAFGGDPERVMVFGESAGAVDVFALLASPLSDGLFHRALAQSGGPSAEPLAEREDEGERFAAEVGCGDASDALACLEALDGEALVAPLESPFVGGLAGGGGFGPAIDGRILTEAPFAAIAAGRHQRVPLILGANADETKITVPVGSVTPAKVKLAYLAFGQTFAPQLEALYPPGTTNAEARESWIRATTDAQFVCPARRVARAAAAGQSEPVRRYHFVHTAPPNAGGANGAFHGLELFYVFGAIHDLFGGAVTRPEDAAVSDAMMGYWGRFAATGDPNGDDAPAWPAHDADDAYLEIAPPPTARTGLRTDACDLWDAIIAAAGG